MEGWCYITRYYSTGENILAMDDLITLNKGVLVNTFTQISHGAACSPSSAIAHIKDVVDTFCPLSMEREVESSQYKVCWIRDNQDIKHMLCSITPDGF